MLGDGGTGVSTYARTLVAAATLLDRPCGLLRGEPRRGDVAKLFAALPTGARRLQAQGPDLVAADIFRTAQTHFNLHGRVLRLRAPGPPGIMHWSYPVPLMIEGWTNLYTIHDLIPLTHPTLTPIAPARHQRLLVAIERVADRIVTVSDAAREAILSVLGWAPGRVVNCGQAVLHEASDQALPEDFRPRGYFLFCGRIEPRKNLARLIEAHRRSTVDLPLLIAGPLAPGGDGLLAKGHRTNPLLLHRSYLDRSTLIGLIANARAVLLPSLAEGFGLPVAEAMMLGTPTLISRDPALVETAGGAALIVDGTDIATIADALGQLARDDALCAALAMRGLDRARAFSVTGFADRLAALYADVEP